MPVIATAIAVSIAMALRLVNRAQRARQAATKTAVNAVYSLDVHNHRALANKVADIALAIGMTVIKSSGLVRQAIRAVEAATTKHAVPQMASLQPKLPSSAPAINIVVGAAMPIIAHIQPLFSLVVKT